MAEKRVRLQVGDHSVSVSSLDRVYWPSLGFTKRDTIRYLADVAPVLLPHLRDRPLTLKRAPEGAGAAWWYLTDCPNPPPWIGIIDVLGADGVRVHRHCAVQDVADLVWLAQVGCLEIHPLLFRRDDPESAVEVVFDLDPGAPADLVNCCEVAREIRLILESVGLSAFVKTSGGGGLHLHVPVSSGTTFERGRAFAHAVARLTADACDQVVLKKGAVARRGKVLVDWEQNGRYRSLPAPYSLRLNELPLVATPLSWDEVDAAVEHRDMQKLLFLPHEVLERVEAAGDPMSGATVLRQALPDLAGA